MRQEYIEMFLEIVKTGNLSTAAENLHLTQSAVSARLRALEGIVGASLFQRGKGNRYVTLTEQGQRFVPIAQRWMLLLRDTHVIGTDQRQSIRLGCIDSISSALLLPLSQKLEEMGHTIRLEIISQQSDAMYDYVVNRDYDLGLVAANGYRSQIAVIPFFSMDMSIVINCSKKEGDAITNPAQLDPSREIYMEYGSHIRAWHNKWWPNTVPQLSIDSFQLLEAYLSIPGKWALIPTGILNRLPASLGLYRCQFGENDVPKRTCYYIYHQQAGFYETKECCALLDCLRQQIAADPTLTLL